MDCPAAREMGDGGFRLSGPGGCCTPRADPSPGRARGESVDIGKWFGGGFGAGDQGEDSGGKGVQLGLGAFDDHPTAEQEPVTGR